MAHLACATHKRRVVYLFDNDRVIVRHRNGDGSPCSSTSLTSKGRVIPTSDLRPNTIDKKEN